MEIKYNNIIAKKIDNVYDFYFTWLSFHNPILGLTMREIKVLAYLLKRRKEILETKKDLSEKEIYDIMISKNERESLIAFLEQRWTRDLTDSHLQVIFSMLRKRKLLSKEDGFNKKILPKKKENKTAQILILIDICNSEIINQLEI